jgi:glycosyltransferase involved in cell wall biosynthesis
LGISAPYLLYLGRVDRNKGCHTLLDYFTEWADAGGRATLVLAGPAKMRVPSHPTIRSLGYVSDADRLALLSHAHVLVVPSPFESLSIALLEGWNHAVPSLVNAHCAVLKGQVRRANGGLYYRTAREFSEGLDFLLSHEEARVRLGRQGRAFVEQQYRWPTVMARVEGLLQRVNEARQAAR